MHYSYSNQIAILKIAIIFSTFMNNDVDVGSLIINSAERPIPLQEFGIFLSAANWVRKPCSNNSFHNTEFKYLNTLEGRCDQIKI